MTTNPLQHQYTLGKSFVAGIKLTGSEIKSARQGGFSIKGAYVRLTSTGAVLEGSYIADFPQAPDAHVPLRPRTLLLNKSELRHLSQAICTKNATIIPLRAFLNKERLKLEIAPATLNINWDKRQTLLLKAARRDTQ